MPVKSKEISCRAGHLDSGEYIAEFLHFLYVRTGYRFENFTTPRHFQHLLDELSFYRVPMRIWQGLMAVTLRIVNMSRTIEHGLREFGAFFIDALVWLAKRLVDMGLLKITIFLFNWCVSPLIRVAIGVLYFAVKWLSDKLWESLSTFIQSRLISAPYYRHFLTIG